MKIILHLIIGLVASSSAMAASAAFWDDLIRTGTRSEKSFEATARAERLAAELASDRGMGKIFIREVDEITDPLARARKAKVLIRETMYFPDESFLKQLDSLSPAELDSALLLARGGRNLVEVVPDVAFRSRILAQGGSDLVAAAGIHGPDVAREASRLDSLIAAGKVPARIGNQTTIARFSEVMRSRGGGAWKFWSENVEPHWKKWVAAGAVVTYLVNPEFFHDAAGELTEAGARELSKIVGAVVAGTLSGAGEGGSQALEKIKAAFSKHFLHGYDSIGAWFGLILTCWILLILLPRTRKVALSPILLLFRKSES